MSDQVSFPPLVAATEAQTSAREFRWRNELAGQLQCAGGLPNFYYDGLLGGTILLRSPGATWRDVPVSELGGFTTDDDFWARMKASQDYAGRQGFVGGFPTFFHADHGSGVVCGTILLDAEVAEWRDVPLSEISSLGLHNIEQRFRGTQDYAIAHGFVGGFPNMYDAGVGAGTVCGTILLRGPSAERRDLLVRNPLK